MRLFFIGILCFLASFRTEPKADLVYIRANIITLEKEGARAQALAIQGNTLLAVGSDAEIQKYIGPKTRIFDLKGKTVIPGFNDVHMHPNPIYAFESPYSVLELDTVSSMKNLIALLRKKAMITPKGMMIMGVGYNETKLGGQPIKDSLDKASREHPIQISHISGHLRAANSYLMDRAGINEKTLDPAGGAFER
jgi:predicted amidohydrolase YtcJ